MTDAAIERFLSSISIGDIVRVTYRIGVHAPDYYEGRVQVRQSYHGKHMVSFEEGPGVTVKYTNFQDEPAGYSFSGRPIENLEKLL